MTPTSTGGSRFRVALTGFAVALALTASIIPVAAKEHKKVPLPTPNTNVQPYTAQGVYTNRLIRHALVAAASNGVTLPTSTIHIQSTSGTVFPVKGQVMWLPAATGIPVVISYDNTGFGSPSSTFTFLNCTGGTGTLTTNDQIFPVYTAGATRRTVSIMLESVTVASGDSGFATAFTTVGGVTSAYPVASAGFVNGPASGSRTAYFTMTFTVDPGQQYGANVQIAGTGNIQVFNWIEVDA